MTTRETDRPLQRFIGERASGQLRYRRKLHHLPGHNPQHNLDTLSRQLLTPAADDDADDKAEE